MHHLGSNGDSAASAGRPAGHARRNGLDHQGHPPVHSPAGSKLRYRSEPDRHAPRGSLAAAIDGLRQAFRILYREGLVQSAALERIESELGTISEVAEFLTFIRESKTGINPMRVLDRVKMSL